MTLTIKVSYFNNAYHDISDLVVDMRQFIEYVRSESLKPAITVLHQIIEEHGLKSKLYGDKKKNLPAICIHGEFQKKVATKDKKTGQVLMLGGRTNQHLSMYSNQVHLDMDKLELQRVLAYQKKLSADPYVHVHFKSPSWRGVKLSCHHPYGPERHDEVYYAFKDYIQKLLGCDPSEFDDVVRSISRLCFASYDPDAFYNPDSLPFLLPKDRAENLREDDTLFNAGTYKIQEEHDLLPDLPRTEEQLQHIGGFDDYDTWIRVGLALKAEHGQNGFRLWAVWSAQSAKYPGIPNCCVDGKVWTLDRFLEPRSPIWQRNLDGNLNAQHPVLCPVLSCIQSLNNRHRMQNHRNPIPNPILCCPLMTLLQK